MPRKTPSESEGAPANKPRSRSAAKSVRPRRAATPAAETPALRPAARSSAAKPAVPRAKRPAVKGSNGAGTAPANGHRADAGTAHDRNSNDNGGLPHGKTAEDYAEVKRALGTLWNDITSQTFSTFDSISRRVEKSYATARKNVTHSDVHYVLEKTQGKLKSLASSGSQMVVRLGNQARLLYEMLRDAVAGHFEMPWVTISAITAALLYFVSPLDIIPDFLPGIGWLDDALVISLAISMARVDLRRYIKEKKLDAALYGL